MKTNNSGIPSINRNTLKWTAFITMLADHAALTLMGEYPRAQEWVRMTAGRMAMPLFLSMFVEGYIYSVGNVENGPDKWKKVFIKKGKNILLLLACAAAAEPFFDLMLYGKPSMARQNVMLTWAVCMLELMLMDAGWAVMPKGLATFRIILCLPVIAAGAAAAAQMRVDYGPVAPCVTGILFLIDRMRAETEKKTPMWISTVVSSGIIAAACRTPGAMLAVLPAIVYDPQKACRKNKYMFYIGYPVHIAVLVALRWGIFCR